jgi:predicted nucleic acid-binding protein
MLTSNGIKIKFLDASALVKLVIDEHNYHFLRDFVNSHTNFFTTWLCLAEALGVIKSKWIGSQSKYETTKIETSKYLEATMKLIIEWRNRIESFDLDVDKSPLEVRRIAERYDIDYSDALLLVTLKIGRYSGIAYEFSPNRYKSALILITTDGKLSSAATAEGISVWNCNTGQAPEWAY